jgi:hypothetical protein
MKLILSIIGIIHLLLCIFCVQIMSRLTVGALDTHETIIAFLLIFLWPVTIPVFFLQGYFKDK